MTVSKFTFGFVKLNRIELELRRNKTFIHLEFSICSRRYRQRDEGETVSINQHAYWTKYKPYSVRAVLQVEQALWATDAAYTLNLWAIIYKSSSSPTLPQFCHLQIPETPSPRNKALIPNSNQRPYKVRKRSRPSSSCLSWGKSFPPLGLSFLICKFLILSSSFRFCNSVFLIVATTRNFILKLFY